MRFQHGLIAIGVLSIMLLFSACTSAASGAPTVSADPIGGTWVEADVDGDAVIVPRTLVEEFVNLHFSVETGGSTLDFMAYVLDDEIQVRANACPPCRSRGFALDGGILVCGACATTFDARDGSGIAGACVDYPKAAVQHRTVNGAITMSLSDLVAAYDETLVAG